MLITIDLANTIVKRAMGIIHHNVNVIDHQGIIIASGEPHRVGEQHEVACEVIKTRQRMVINSTEVAAKFKNVQLGINHPIIVDDKVVFVIGISGNPAVIGRYAELAILVAELLIQQARDIREINWQYRIRDLLIKQLLTVKDPMKTAEICQQLKQHNIDLDRSIVPIIIHMKTGGNLLNKTMGDLLSKTFDILSSQQVILLSNDDILLLVPVEQDVEQIANKLNAFFRTQLSHYIISIGMESHSSELFCQSICTLEEMLRFANKSKTIQTVISCKTFALPALLEHAQSSYFSAFLKGIVEQILQANTGATLLETLRGFIDNNAGMSKTSAALNVHRNTLSYRLNQIKVITGFNPLILSDITQLTIGLYYYDNSLVEVKG